MEGKSKDYIHKRLKELKERKAVLLQKRQTKVIKEELQVIAKRIRRYIEQLGKNK